MEILWLIDYSHTRAWKLLSEFSVSSNLVDHMYVHHTMILQNIAFCSWISLQSYLDPHSF